MTDPGRVLILGAGPTGLGAAYRLQKAGFADFMLVDAGDSPGGLASSYVDSRGFTWDVGGHVQFSHYKRYDDLLDLALGQNWLRHQRESWIWIKRRFVPYPLQNNIHRLDSEDRDRILKGLEDAARFRALNGPPNFRDWIPDVFGDALAEFFLYPYNVKVWGFPLEMLGTRWMGERVALPDLARIRRNIQENHDDTSWGPNNTFRFPLVGGTGAIWRSVASLIPAAKLEFGIAAVRIDLDGRKVLLSDGRSVPYDHLITTLPLDLLCQMCDGLSYEARTAAAHLLHSSVHIIGFGLRGRQPETVGRKCWMYFPEPHSPYYRVTVFSNYSPNNVPSGDGFWSLMAEVCESAHKPVDGGGLCRWALEAMREDGLIAADTEVVSVWHKRAEHGYPTPFVGRDEVLACVLPHLETHRVLSRGRFGAWKYEVSNQDHTCMQGVELAERLLGIGEEVTISRPDYVNSGALLHESGNRISQSRSDE
jgi:protoporphyrinogen oxidase